MGTNIPGQNKVRRMASNLHKYRPAAMHLGWERPFICKAKGRVVRGVPQPHSPASPTRRLVRLYSTTWLHSWGLKESHSWVSIFVQFGSTFFFFFLHSFIPSIHCDHAKLPREAEWQGLRWRDLGCSPEAPTSQLWDSSKSLHPPALQRPHYKVEGRWDWAWTSLHLAECFTHESLTRGTATT